MVGTSEDGQQKTEGACGNIRVYVRGMNYMINSLDAFKWNDVAWAGIQHRICSWRKHSIFLQNKNAGHWLNSMNAPPYVWWFIKHLIIITAQNYPEYCVDSIFTAAYEYGLH